MEVFFFQQLSITSKLKNYINTYLLINNPILNNLNLNYHRLSYCVCKFLKNISRLMSITTRIGCKRYTTQPIHVCC